jgi:hypothetical protein
LFFHDLAVRSTGTGCCSGSHDGEVLAGTEVDRRKRVEAAVAFVVSLGSRTNQTNISFGNFRCQAGSKISSG